MKEAMRVWKAVSTHSNKKFAIFGEKPGMRNGGAVHNSYSTAFLYSDSAVFPQGLSDI
jgi:hypothetical protein